MKKGNSMKKKGILDIVFYNLEPIKLIEANCTALLKILNEHGFLPFKYGQLEKAQFDYSEKAFTMYWLEKKMCSLKTRIFGHPCILKAESP
jgi:hypothetical protein